MKLKFWGVRGSLPTPLTPQQIQSKIMAVVQRIKPEDIKSSEAKAKFVADLPQWIFGTTGGNTACVELTAGNNEFILDAGSGIRVLGKNKKSSENHHYNLFFSHFHWDHIQGFPFFDDIYNPDATFDVYSCVKDAQKCLEAQMSQPYFPVQFDSVSKKFKFHYLEPGKEADINGVKVNCVKMFHPGDSHSFSFEFGGKKVVYATDVELRACDFYSTLAGTAVFKDADCVILDSQYTVEEYYTKSNWGHSAFCYAIDFAIYWNIKKIFLFHHEPTYDDKKLNSILEAAKWYAQYTNHSEIEVNLAKEGLEVKL